MTEASRTRSGPESMDLDGEDHHHTPRHRGVPYPGEPHWGTPRLSFSQRADRGRVPYPDDPQPGTIIPNRIFVGGMDSTIVETDLWQFFSEHGQVKEVKIMLDHSGVPKGYGFVSFETREDVQKLLQNKADRVQFKDKEFYIAPAIRQQPHQSRRGSQRRGYEGHHTRGHHPSMPVTMAPPPSLLTVAPPPSPVAPPLTPVTTPPTPVALPPSPVTPPPSPAPYGPVHLFTPDGLPYTYHNGMAYFQVPGEDIQSAHHTHQPWPPSPGVHHHHAYPPVILSPHPQQPTYHHYQYMPEYSQQYSVYLYREQVEQARASGCWVHPTVPYRAISEEQTVQVLYQGVHPMPRIKTRHSRRFSHRHHGARLAYIPPIPELSEPEEPSSQSQPGTQAAE